MKQSLESAGRRLAGVAAALVLAGCASFQAGSPSGTNRDGSTEPPSANAPGAESVASNSPGANAEASPQKAIESSEWGSFDPANAGPVVVPVPQPMQPKERDLWNRIRAGFAMPDLDSSLVTAKEKQYLQNPEYLKRMFERAGKYLYFIVDEVERRGMPLELALLPFVESAMNPVALSSAKAAGLWQFIPSTGKVYNLSQNWWVDNRRDVVQSTQAALDYLQKIYEMHDRDWFLALASYNWGEYAVARAVKHNRARGLPTDYLSLSMPRETRHYVPKLMAIKNIVANAAELGIQLPPMANKPYFVTIEKTRPIDLKLAARFAGMTVEEFVALNPAHNRPVIAASKNNQLKLPIDRVDAFVEAVEKHGGDKKPLASWQPYTIKPSETLESVATRQGVGVTELRTANGLRSGQKILAGTRILVPHTTVTNESEIESFVAPRVVERIDHPPGYHRVGKRDTIDKVARRYGLSVATLMSWNKLGKAAVRPGQSLLVRQPYSQTVVTAENGARHVLASSGRSPVSHAAEDTARGERVTVRGARAGKAHKRGKSGRQARIAAAN